MVTILDDQVICITIVPCGLALHELPNLNRVQACRPNKYRLPELKAWALPRFNLKDAARRVVMCSKRIFYTMNFHAGVKNTEACPVDVSIHGC